ncbi:hypothetical protein [Sulfurisphaera ohwakuensis]|uniref:Uncharacterized protein n=1 Tax=Sulfurisphaera ohwakuensis TaxID=69656 RepID=A0A7J9RV94_SULOH|nr:hypothetical protein [Sulfurisphaera ohwakuensis]MBB5254100.1 hypothetical protein [Sulfurisphaera ohwakuensis]
MKITNRKEVKSTTSSIEDNMEVKLAPGASSITDILSSSSSCCSSGNVKIENLLKKK